MPPPDVAVLPVTWLWFKVRAPPGSGIGPFRGRPLAMPPPSPSAVLPLTTLWLSVRVVGTVPGGPWALMIPPPEASTPLPAAVFPFTSDLFNVIVPWLTIPAPLVWLAVLLSTLVLFKVALPPFAIPPAAIGGPPSDPGWGTGAVAVLPFTSDLLKMS